MTQEQPPQPQAPAPPEPEQTKNVIVESAKKQRHLLLLEKVKNKEALTPPELRELEAFEGQVLPAGTVRTEREVAVFFNVSVRTVQNWKRDGMPVNPDKTYSLEAVSNWHEETIKKFERRNGVGEDWETRFRQAKALLAELDLRKREGELVELRAVNEERVQRILVVKQALLALPAQLAPQVVGLEVKKAEAIIRKRLEAVIANFAAGAAALVGIEPASAPAPAPPQAPTGAAQA